MATISFVDTTDLLYVLTKLKGVLSGNYVAKETGKGLSSEDFTSALLTKLNGISESADSVSFNRIVNTGTKIAEITINGTKTDIYANASVTFDSSMSSTSENGVQNKVIKQYVDDAVASVVSIEFRTVASLPATGEAGVIYLVPNGGSGSNTKDEYVWISSETRFEKIGTTDVDLSGYVQTSDLVAITTSDIDTMFSSVWP